MIGYRFWRVESGKLSSPFAHDELPEDGLLVAQCERHTPPGPGCRCGVSFYATYAEALAAARFFPNPWTITKGVVTGPVLPDVHMRPYQDGFRWVNIPPGKRCAAYQVVSTEDNGSHG